MAGLWRPVAGSSGAFTMLTCPPGPDVAPIHNRQIVVLEKSQWERVAESRLLGTRPAAAQPVRGPASSR